ncbi:hypothetical protein IB642_05200 [Allofrancisella guangzhouensis]|uniref:Uncharacterized protein n=1 Tax=Allofrancisella guangzhouensis TaxID=594679 RepID=A0A0A8E597_9GAMM|nr:hypothetical protein [Allofrancisella guangzhouensis]AJC48782.1 hypothetical protein SD28_03605 [Allofrancisella guangzhouensis]MBK2028003.1 hypothetical protein [Allofrancisella guangzhouensis]MBK2044415.1 hypothetical protein [Allofrancisella guangzhouensis]MBK2045279.1 hypothetical protein [Allofrancisella guangzhouensis]
MPFPDQNEESLWRILLTDGRHMVKVPVGKQNYIHGLKRPDEYEKEEPGYYSAQIAAIIKMQNTQRWNAEKYKELHTIIKTKTGGKANTSSIKQGCQCSYELVDYETSKAISQEHIENFNELRKQLGINAIMLDKIEYNSIFMSAQMGYFPGQKLSGLLHKTKNFLTNIDSAILCEAIMDIYNRDIDGIDACQNASTRKYKLFNALAKTIQNLEICHLENDLNTRTLGAFVKIETNKYLGNPCMFYYPSMGGNSTKKQIYQELEMGLQNATYVLSGASSLVRYNFHKEEREISDKYIERNADKYEVNRSLWMQEGGIKERDINLQKLNNYYCFTTKQNSRNLDPRYK